MAKKKKSTKKQNNNKSLESWIWDAACSISFKRRIRRTRLAKPGDKPSYYDKLVDRISKLAEGLREVDKLAESYGIFLNDRELLRCPDCGIEEDVLADGRLIVCPIGKPEQETGVKFDTLKENGSIFICPVCRKKIMADDA